MTRLCALLLLLGCADSPAASGSAPEPAAGSDPVGLPARLPEGTRAEAPASMPASIAFTAGDCESALPLPGNGDSALLVPTMGVAPGLGCAPALGAAGAYFVLDLSAARAPVPVQLLFDAPVPFEVGLARGACGDLRVEQCATPLYSDERSRVLSATLAPDRYLLLVDSAAVGAELHVNARAGTPSCAAAAQNDECASALPLDPLAPVQSVTGTLGCAHPSVAVRCSSFQAADVFYALDLSDRPGDTLLDVDVTGTDERPVTAALFDAAGDGCGDIWMCGFQFSARLAPGVYRIGVSDADRWPGGRPHPFLPDVADGEPSPFALRIGLGPSACSQSLNNSWQNAVDLDPTAEQQIVRGNTACGTDLLRDECFGDRGAPELYYRLDLRGAPGPRELTVHSLLGADTVYSVLVPDPAGGVPQFTSCKSYLDDAVTYQLAPRLYYFVVDGRVRNAARFELELRLHDELQGSLQCVLPLIETCMADSEPACSDSMANPACLASAVECGLEQNAYDAFCGGASGCCSGTAEGLGCLQAWQSTAQCR
jgi:hypothetical protein